MDILQVPVVRKAERKLVSAISSLNLQTIKFLAEDLGEHTVYAHRWDDCPMTLAQRVGNTLIGKSFYQNRNNVGAFATAWDQYMDVLNSEYNRNSDDYPGIAGGMTNGFGAEQVQRIARTELEQRKSSKYQQVKQRIIESNTTECARETIGQTESEAIFAAITGTTPDTVVKP